MTTAPLAIRPPYTIRERWLAAYRDWRRGRRDLEPGQTPAQLALMTIQRIGRIGAIPNDIMDMRVRSPIGRKPAWWQVAGKTCVAAYQPKGAASLAASYVNLANPGTYDAAPGVAPTWASATGWTFNGSTQYLTTGVIPANGYSALVRFANCSPIDNCIFGYYEAGDTLFTIETAGAVEVYDNGGRLVVLTPSDSAAIMGFAGNTPYKNGLPVAGTIGAWGAAATSDFYIGARHRVDISSVDMYKATDILALVVYSDTLTAGEVSTVSAAMAALTG